MGAWIDQNLAAHGTDFRLPLSVADCAAPGALALYMHDLPLSPTKLKYYSWHKWMGVTVFLLALVRVAVRLVRGTPELPASMRAWERKAAALSHGALYLLILVVPISGWIYSS